MSRQPYDMFHHPLVTITNDTLNDLDTKKQNFGISEQLTKVADRCQFISRREIHGIGMDESEIGLFHSKMTEVSTCRWVNHWG